MDKHNLTYMESLELCAHTLRVLLADPTSSISILAEGDLQRELEEGKVTKDKDVEDKSWKKRELTRLRAQRRRSLTNVEDEFGIELLDSSQKQGTAKRPTAEAIEVLQKVEYLIATHKEVVHGRENTTVRISAIDAAANFWIPRAIGASGCNADIHCTTREWWQVLNDVRIGLA